MKKKSIALEKSIYRLFEITPTPTILSFPDGKLEYVNQALKDLLGYHAEEIFAKDVIITHPGDVNANQIIRKSLSADPFTPIRIEKRYVHKQGHIINGLLIMVAQPDDNGVVKRYIAQITDLTSIKQSKAAEMLLYHLVEKSSDAIYVIDPKSGRFLNCNTLAYKRLGYTKKELLTLTVPQINPNFISTEKWERHLSSIKLKENSVLESTHRHKNGDLIPIEASISYTNYHNIDYILAVVRDITERKIKESEVLISSNLDPLTKLPNRRVLENRLDEIFLTNKEKDTMVAFIYVDLDGFKEINDTHGHTTGDGILVGAAGRLKRCIRDTDIISRIGGDEFLIVIHDIKTKENIEKIAQKIVNELKGPSKVKTQLLDISASVGVAIHKKGEGQAESLIHAADQAMYSAKQTVGPTVCFKKD